MHYPTIAEAIRGVRGMYLSNDTSYDSVGVRGFSHLGDYGNRVLILIDGHPANDNYIFSSYVGFDGRTDIDDIERIEIIRGPGSVLYGTSAFFGVINLITRSRDMPTHGEAKVDTVLGAGRGRVTGYWRFGKDAGAWMSVAAAHSAGRDFFFEEMRTGSNVPSNTNQNACAGGTPDYNGLPCDGNARGLDAVQLVHAERALVDQGLHGPVVPHHAKEVPARGRVLHDVPRPEHELHRHARLRRSALRAEARRQSVQLFTRAHVDMYNFDDYLGYPSRRARRHGRRGGLVSRALGRRRSACPVHERQAPSDGRRHGHLRLPDAAARRERRLAGALRQQRQPRSKRSVRRRRRLRERRHPSGEGAQDLGGRALRLLLVGRQPAVHRSRSTRASRSS